MIGPRVSFSGDDSAGPAAENSFNAQERFAPAKGFRYAIMRAEFEADDAIHLLGFGGEYDDRDV